MGFSGNTSNPRLSLETEQIVETFGFFLTVLIGLECLETTKNYLAENRVHAEEIFPAAIIAGDGAKSIL